MTSNEIISLDRENIMQTYGRLEIAPVKGKNATMTDADGKEYIDFTSGIGVNSLGWCDDGWVSAVEAQLHKIQHFSNYFFSETAGKLAKMLTESSGLKRVFFGNSGAEANEGAIKLARKYSYDKYGEGRATIITLQSSFHGRTVTTLAATGQDVFHQFFYPFTEGFKYAPANDIAALEAMLTDDVCAIMAEPIQGEGGVNVLDTDYAKAVRAICDKRDILLIFDEVQTGIGRTGTLYGFEGLGVKPDILTLAKGLGGGLPIGAFLGGEKVENTLGAGMHGTTFGANPIATAGACEVMSRVNTPEFLAEVNKKGEYIINKVMATNPAKVKSVRGRGMMIGFAVEGNPKDILHTCADNGLLVLTAGKDVIRLLPPLTISYEEIDKGVAILADALK